jgi:Cu/Ag efflux pump CusA
MKAIGTAVTGGMLSATFIDLFYIPLFFVLVSKAFKVKRRRARAVEGSASFEGTQS